MAVPAGFEDEFDSDYDEFDFEYSRPKHVHYEPRERTVGEKLIDAVRDNDVEAAQRALDDGANIHAKLSYSRQHSPIMEAASWGHYEIMEFLVTRGADVNDSYEMYNVIMCLCDSSSSDEDVLVKCLNFLIAQGADPLTTDWVGTTSLICAVRQNKLLLAKRLIEFEKSLIEKTDGEGWTPLFFAVSNRNINTVRFLVSEGAAVNAVGKSGHTLWEMALASNVREIMELIVPADLIDAEYSDENVGPAKLYMSAYKEAMLSAPRRDDRLYGFHKETINFIRGIGLDCVLPVVEKEQIQFAQLLTWNDDNWKAVGISLSYHLKKISLAIRRYHEQPWGRKSLPDPNAVVIEGCVDLLKISQLLLTCVRIAHITSASSMYLLRYHDEPSSVTRTSEINNLLTANAILHKQLVFLKNECSKIDDQSSYPPDLIKKQIPVKRKKSSVKFVICSGIICAVIFKYRFLKMNVVDSFIKYCNVFKTPSLH